MVNEQELHSRQASPPNIGSNITARTATSSPSQSHLAKLPPSPTRTAEAVIRENSKGTAGRDAQARRSYRQQQNGRKAISKAQIALSDPKILDIVFTQLWDEFLVYGREARQSHFRNLTVVCKSWVESASQWLWMNPYFGTARRAASLEQCLRRSPERGLHIRKLIFGEGSSTDILDWVTKHNVPNLLRHAPNVQVVGMGGLKNVHLNDTRDALQSRLLLEEVRACDLMPEPWCYIDYLFDDVLRPCKSLSRLRLYNIYTENSPPQPLEQKLTQIAFNYCAIDSTDLINLFASSKESLQRLHFEYPMDLDENDLLRTLEYVGAGLRELTVQGFLAQAQDGDPPNLANLVDRILEVCPNLVVLNFPEALASPEVFDRLQGSKLELWSFSCGADVRPEHWLEALRAPSFPRPANCRVYCSGWEQADVRKVRIQAFSIGVNWLLSGATITEMSEDHVNGKARDFTNVDIYNCLS